MTLITRELAAKVVATVDKGLCSGLGKPIPGQMCVEAAVCYAMGMPHSDQPICVGAAVRAFKITLNDANWSSPQARAKGLRRIAVAQLGSDTIDQQEFAKELSLQTIKQILPTALRAVNLEKEALVCEASSTLESAESAAESAAWSAAKSAAKSAWSAAESAWSAAESAKSAWSAAESAESAWSAAKSAWSAKSAAESAESAARDALLSKMAEIGVQVLIKLGAKGVEWLNLCD